MTSPTWQVSVFDYSTAAGCYAIQVDLPKRNGSEKNNVSQNWDCFPELPSAGFPGFGFWHLTSGDKIG